MTREGQKVRFFKQRGQFAKAGSYWSREVKVVQRRDGNRYFIGDSLQSEDSQSFRPYELQLVREVEVAEPADDAVADLEVERETMRKQWKQAQILHQESIAAENVRNFKRVRRAVWKLRRD